MEKLSGQVMATMRAAQPVLCSGCSADEMRFKVMLYDDEQGDCITPEDVFERLDDDLAVAGAVLWVGISFEQSASTEYFRKVRHMSCAIRRAPHEVVVATRPAEHGSAAAAVPGACCLLPAAEPGAAAPLRRCGTCCPARAGSAR